MNRPTAETWDRLNTEAVSLLHARTGLTQAAAARALGYKDPRALRLYLNGTRPCPFLVGLGLWAIGED